MVILLWFKNKKYFFLFLFRTYINVYSFKEKKNYSEKMAIIDSSASRMFWFCSDDRAYDTHKRSQSFDMVTSRWSAQGNWVSPLVKHIRAHNGFDQLDIGKSPALAQTNSSTPRFTTREAQGSLYLNQHKIKEQIFLIVLITFKKKSSLKIPMYKMLLLPFMPFSTQSQNFVSPVNGQR